MRLGRQPAYDHLNDYWNALARNASPDEVRRLGEQLDPARKAALDQARSRYQRERPDPAFLARLETELMNAFATTPAGTIPLPRSQPLPSNGRVQPRTATKWLPSLPETGNRRRFAIAQVAAVVLLILALIGGGYYLFDQRNDHPALIQPTTPEATPSPDKNQYRYGPNRPGVSPSDGPTGQPIELWSAQTQGPITAEPAIVDGVVFISSGDGFLHAFDAATGEERWQFEIGLAGAASPAVANDVVYIGTDGGTLYAVDVATGEERWSFAGARDNASPAILDGVLYTSSRDGNLYALQTDSGEVIWTASLGAPASRSATVEGGMVFVGSESGVFHAFDSTTGEERWQFQAVAGNVGTLAAVDGTVFGTIDGLRLYAIDAATGTERWSFQTESGGLMSIPVVSEGTLYTASEEGIAYALDAASGTEKWRFSTSGAFSFAPTLADGVFYIANGDGYLYGVDAETGLERFRVALGGEVNLGPAILDGVAYVGNHLGVLYAVGGASEPLVQAPSAASPEATPAATEALVAEPIWQLGQEAGGFGGRGDMAIGPDGNIWVTDVTNNVIQVISPTGELLSTWGTPGSGEGELDFSIQSGIEIDSAGNVYIVTGGGPMHGVQKFDAEGNFLLHWGETGEGNGQFLEASDVALDADGNVWVSDWRREDIQKFSPDGEYLLTIGGPDLVLAPRIGADAEGNLYAPSGKKVYKFAPDGKLLLTVGSDAASEGQLGTAIDIAVDAAGNIYVSDAEKNQIIVFDEAGNFLTTIGSFGAEPGQFVEPDSLRWADNGSLYVSDWGNRRIQKFAITSPIMPGAPVASISADLVWSTDSSLGAPVEPWDVSIAPDGSVWLLVGPDGEALALSRDGELIERWSGSDELGGALVTVGQGALAIGPDGSMYAIDYPNRAIQAFDRDRNYLLAWGEPGTGDGQFTGLSDIAVDPNGDVYVADWLRNDVQKFAPDGSYLLTISGPADGLEFGYSLARIGIDHKGNLYVPNGSRVDQFDPDGNLLMTFGNDGSNDGQLGFAVDVAVDDAGFIYVSDAQDNDIKVFDSTGAYVDSFGSFGSQPGQFVTPDALAWRDGRLYVVDIDNHRLQAFEVTVVDPTPA